MTAVKFDTPDQIRARAEKARELARIVTDELKAATRAKGSLEDKLLPANCRFHFERGGREMYVMELPPRVRPIKIDSDYGIFSKHKDKQGMVKLSFPYVVHTAVFVASHIPVFNTFFRNERLKSLDDKLLVSPMPHVSMNGAVCLGDGTRYIRVEPRHLSAEDAVTAFWDTRFVYYATGFPGRGQFPRGFSEDEWVRLSRDDPQAILEVRWEEVPRDYPYGKTVRTFAEAYVPDTSEQQTDAVAWRVREKVALALR